MVLNISCSIYAIYGAKLSRLGADMSSYRKYVGAEGGCGRRWWQAHNARTNARLSIDCNREQNVAVMAVGNACVRAAMNQPWHEKWHRQPTSGVPKTSQKRQSMAYGERGGCVQLSAAGSSYIAVKKKKVQSRKEQ